MIMPNPNICESESMCQSLIPLPSTQQVPTLKFIFIFLAIPLFLSFFYYTILYALYSLKNMERFTNLRVILAEGPC